jgi:dimeric dUTPase (all-alpha-NTP-PPase superfamily)
MSNLNPENKCSQLYKNNAVDGLNGQWIERMFEMQQSLQSHLGQDLSKMSLQERTDLIMKNWSYLTAEYTEMLENLPFKSWKKYTDEQKQTFNNAEHQLETYYEFIDIFCFFCNIGILLGIDGKTFTNLYVTKNQENFDRQKRGY